MVLLLEGAGVGNEHCLLLLLCRLSCRPLSRWDGKGLNNNKDLETPDPAVDHCMGLERHKQTRLSEQMLLNLMLHAHGNALRLRWRRTWLQALSSQ